MTHRLSLTPVGPWLAIVLACALAGCVMHQVHSIPPATDDALRPVVAVTSFENRSGFSGQWQLGDGMADLLVSELVGSRRFTVVERQHFERLAGEIGRQQTSLFRPEGKTAVGRMKNAQFMIRGVVNDFSQSGGAGLWMAFRSLLFFGRGNNARVAVTLTIVDVETGQIISSVNSTGIVRSREAYAEGAYKGVTFGGDIFFKTPLGKATLVAIRSGVRQIVRDMPRTLWRPMVCGTREGYVLLNGGTDRKFRQGALYTVRAPAEPVTDPSTGDVLAFVPGRTIGTLRVVRVDETLTFATPVQGSGFARGQWLTAPDALPAK
jgi:curli biogenesis system outer membrane secretion channel CsgG